MDNKPLVSIVVSFLNSEKFIQEAIESVFGQTYNNWELLLVDDGSTDGGTQIALQYAEKYPGKVRYLEHRGHQRVRTQLVDMRSNYLTVYAIRDLTLSKDAYEFVQQDSIDITLSIICDGSFKLWLNGIGIVRSHNERTTPEEGVSQALDIDITGFARELLLPGENVLAAECSDDVINSGSFLFIPTLRVREW